LKSTWTVTAFIVQLEANFPQPVSRDIQNTNDNTGAPTALQLDPNRLIGRAKQGPRGPVTFEIPWETARGWPGQHDDKWHWTGASTVAEQDMNRGTYSTNGELRRQKYQKITTMVVRILACLLVANCTMAQSSKLSAEKQARIESIISNFMAVSDAPSISAGVVQDGEFVWSAGFGMADLENSIPATSQTVYRLGSISKSITATAAMELWEHGKLDLDSPVQKYCPEFPQKPWPITTRELLGHLAGIRYYNVPETPYSESQSDPEVGNTRHFENGIEAGLKFFANDRLVAQPGTHFNYSTQGYTLVACAIEGSSGEKYADYVREHVLVPSGMLQTRPDDRFAIIPLRARFYSRDKSRAVVNAEFLDSSYKVAGGGWLSSASDMARFEAAILSDHLVKNTTRDIMWTPQMPSDGLGRMVYGLGWQGGTMNGVRDVGHGGSQQGASAMMLIAPDTRAGVVVLINSDAAGASELASQLLQIVLGLPPDHHKETAVDPKLYDGYLGSYEVSSVVISIVRDGAHLFAQINGEKNETFPESARDYFFKDFDIQITFVTDGNGRATNLILHKGGTETDPAL
jgi:serine beta-lactamase-like protein LACTB